MADIRKQYIELLNDYDPYGQDEEENLEITSKNSLDDMLYNLCCMVTLNFQGCTEEELQDDGIYQNMWKLINLLTILGAKATLN